jgi:hypothetical protein
VIPDEAVEAAARAVCYDCKRDDCDKCKRADGALCKCGC